MTPIKIHNTLTDQKVHFVFEMPTWEAQSFLLEKFVSYNKLLDAIEITCEAPIKGKSKENDIKNKFIVISQASTFCKGDAGLRDFGFTDNSIDEFMTKYPGQGPIELKKAVIGFCYTAILAVAKE